MSKENYNIKNIVTVIVTFFSVILLILMLFLGGRYIFAHYEVTIANLNGEAELAKATQTKLIIIQQAKAEKEAEVLKAEGTAQANKIIGESLKNNEAYLQWMWINRLDNQTNKTFVYVPTSGLIPNLESGRIGLADKGANQ